MIEISEILLPPRERFEKEISLVRKNFLDWVQHSVTGQEIKDYLLNYASSSSPFPMVFPYIFLKKKDLKLDVSEMLLVLQMLTGTIDHYGDSTRQISKETSSFSIYFLTKRWDELVQSIEKKSGVKLKNFLEYRASSITNSYFALLRAPEFGYSSVHQIQEIRGSLFQRCSFLNGIAGELCAKIDERSVEEQVRLKQVGESLSLAYSILDDVVDLPNDIVSGKWSFPITTYYSQKENTWAKVIRESLKESVETLKIEANNPIDLLNFENPNSEYFRWLLIDYFPATIYGSERKINWLQLIEKLSRNYQLFFGRNDFIGRIDKKKLTVVSPSKKYYFRLNESATLLLKSCTGRLSLVETIKLIAKRYNEDEAVVKRDHIVFLSEQVKQGIVDFSFKPFEGGEWPVSYAHNSPPKYLDWQLITSCNCHCTHCYQEKVSYEVFTPRDVAFKLVEEIATYPMIHVNITGGEPFLIPYISELLEAVSSIGCVVTISSNGSLITNNHISLLERLGISVQISLDGIGAKHDQIRGVPGLFEKAIKTISHLVDKNIEVTIAFCMNNRSIDDSEKVCQLTKNLGVSCFRPLFFLPVRGAASKQDLILAPEKYFSKVEDLIEKYNSSTFDVSPNLCNNLSQKKTSLKKENIFVENCPALKELVGILPNGDCVPCPLFGNSRCVIGNINSQSLRDIWNSNRSKDVKKTLFSPNKKHFLKNHLTPCIDCPATFQDKLF